MLTILDRLASRDCGGMSRRDFLQVGSFAVAGLSLPQWLSTSAAAASSSPPTGAFRGKSVVLLFLCGGASHIETFDPKLSAPADFRSVTGGIATRLPGVQFGGTFPELARRADQMAIVRSFAPHEISDHARAIKHLLTTGNREDSSIGSRFARLRGASHPATGTPSYCTLIEANEVDSQYVEDRDRMRIGSEPGGLGRAYAPFAPGSGGELMESMQLQMPIERLQDRRALLKSLDQMRRQTDASGAMQALDKFERQAVEVILGGHVRQALDLSQEDPRIVQRYDTSEFKVGWTAKRPSTLGHRLLMARRLCQAGCGLVTVGSAGWDNHANGLHPNVFHGMHLLGRPLDKAVSAFLDDVREQGLSDDILLVITSEFGRTPKIANNGGRDHWPGLDLLVFCGGGLRMGQVIGESTDKAEVPKSDPVGYSELLGTIWHTLFDVGKLRLQRGLPRGLLTELEEAQPLRQLV